MNAIYVDYSDKYINNIGVVEVRFKKNGWNADSNAFAMLLN